ncbi:hypothetical protein QFC22_004605 [Naganishia vaughanmartiniae]|uniref:Uncharacterized protein n=1 Tax=Naganishia vaughanmartiniae TaxID=1424756 RepID=A0ACC2WZ88_9TREE|nr:hypothetical protein QFC22_004605 [Naganishia vaughanmartiniae]
MCGRFALGLPPAEIRMGVANHFPRLLRNPEARAARARHGEQGRQRQRQDRERRRARAGGVVVRGSGDVLQQESGEQRGDAEEEELEWPVSEQDESFTTTTTAAAAAAAGRASDNPEDEEELAAAAARLRWEDEERFRIGNYNVAPRSNGVVLRLRPRSRSQSRQAEAEEGQESDLRLRGGGEEGESVSRMKEADGKNVWDVGDQELVIETM